MSTTPGTAPDGTEAANKSAKFAAKPPAKSPRRRAREFALQGLYQWQISNNDQAAIEAHMGHVAGFQKDIGEFFTGLLHGVLAQHEALREQLQAYLDRPFKSFRRSRPAFCWLAPMNSPTTRKHPIA